MQIGKALHLCRHFVYARYACELAPGTHLTLAAFLILRIVPVGHLLAEQHPPESFHTHTRSRLVVVLRFLVDILVQQRAPVHNEQPVRVVVRARHALELTCRDQFTGEDVAAPLNALMTVVGELHPLPVESDAVADNREYRARAEDIVVKTFLLERVVLRQTRLVHQIHRLLHRVADILVIGREGEEIVVDFLYIVW